MEIKEKNVTLLVLTLNEIEGIQSILPQIRKDFFKEIIVVDGGSTDGTLEWCSKNQYKTYIQKLPGIRNAYFEIWPQIKTEFVLTLSPDGNCDVNKIPLFFEKMDKYDLIIGSRYLPGVFSEDDDLITSLGNKIFNFLARVLFGSNLTDVMVIYRLLRTDLPQKLDLFNEKNYAFFERVLYTKISWEPLMSIRAINRNMKVGEIPAGEPARMGGTRKLQIIRWGAAYLGQFILESITLVKTSKKSTLK